MDDFVQLVERGKNECQKAHAELGLVPVEIPLPAMDFPVSLERMRNHFSVAARVRVAAKLLGRNTLEEASKELEEFIDFAARFKFKKRLRCELKLDRILTVLGVHFQGLGRWLEEINDPQRSTIAKMEEGVQAAINGDDQMRRFWGIDRLPQFLITTLRGVPRMSQLRSRYYASATFATAAAKIGDHFLQKIASTTTLYIKWFATETYPGEQLETTVTAAEVCDTILNEVQEIRDLINCGELPLLEWSRQRHSRIADELEAEISEEDGDPTFLPQQGSDSSSEEDDSPLPKSKRRRVTAGNNAENDGQKKPEVSPSLPASLTPAARPGQNSEDDAENDGCSNSEVSPSLPASPKTKPASSKSARRKRKTKDASLPASRITARTGQNSEVDAENDGSSNSEVLPSLSASPKPAVQRSHHAKRTCPVCNKQESNLKRHLQSHARKGLIEEENIDAMVQIATHTTRRRGPSRNKGQKKGLKLKWCPVGNCKTVTAYMRSHLTKGHEMKPGALLENSLRLARDYRGRKEADLLPKPPTSSPRSSLSSTPTVTSTLTSVTPRTTSSTPCIVTSTITSASPSVTPSSLSSATTTRCSAGNQPPPPLATTDSESEQSGDPDYVPRETALSYFTNPNPSDDRQRWLAGFYRYLNTPDCGRKRSKNRLQHTCQAKQILEDLDPNGSDLTILSMDKGYVVWTCWVDPRMEDLSSGTIRSYLGTYQWFLTFVTMDRVRPGQVPDLQRDVLLILRATLLKLKGWRKTVDLEMRPKLSEKRLQECDSQLTNEDVKAFTRSKIAYEAEESLQTAKDGHPLTANQLCLVRDYLIAELTITTGTRPGALGNATVAHYQSARPAATSHLRVMLVPDHKRGVAGPAAITFVPTVQQHMDIYLQFVRPQITQAKAGALFLTMDGNPFTKDTICRRLPEIWRKSGVRPDLRVTATNIRKWIVTVCHESKVAGLKYDETALRLAMCHSKQTAETFYLRQDMTEVAARATIIIGQCTNLGHVAAAAANPPATLTCPAPSCSGLAPAMDAENDGHNNAEVSPSLPASMASPAIADSLLPSIQGASPPTATLTCPAPSCSGLAPAMDAENDGHNNAEVSPSLPASMASPAIAESPLPSIQGASGPPPASMPKPVVSESSTDSDTGDEPSAPTRPLSDLEKSRLSVEFQDWVTDNRKVVLVDVRHKLRNASSVTLRKLLQIRNMDVKVANRIRHLQSTVPASLPQEELTKEDLVTDWQNAAQSDASRDTTSSSRKEWSEDDAETLRRMFQDLPKCPTRKQLRDKQATCEELQDIVLRNSLERTYNKIKNMLYKIRKG